MRGLGVIAIVCVSLGVTAGIAACAGGQEPDNSGGFTGPGDDGGAGAEGSVSAGEGGSSTMNAEGGGAGSEAGASGGEGGAVLPEGGGGTAAIPCGSAFCRADETCISNTCALPTCTGPTVPGDYATISAALTALSNTGTDVTICLKAQTYSGSAFSITDPGTHQKAFNLVGVSSDATIIQGTVTLGTGFANANITGVTIDGQGGVGLSQTATTTTNLTLTASRLRGANGAYLQNMNSTVTFDGVDMMPTTSTQMAMYAYASGTNVPAHLTIKNSYLHDSTMCIETNNIQTTDLDNNTFLNCAGALYGAGTGSAFNYYNNIIAKSSATAINIQSGVNVAHGNNALWGNMTNYAGMAVAGTGYVTNDCMLDSHSPPGLGAGSPCRTAGDTMHAPTVDYYDVNRGTKADIGAVQSP
jgi:hypothetical protein